jgi:hypothetical protein
MGKHHLLSAMNSPQFPLYIPSKGRWLTRLTSQALTDMRLPHYIIVEQQEYDLYHEQTALNQFVTLLVLPAKYKQEYDCFDRLGLTKSTGPGPARNFAWDHSIETGHAWHWVMDDNIREFLRLNNNLKIRVLDGTPFRVMEDFTLRYANVGMTGPNYRAFASQNGCNKPFVTNTRIYSCNLIRNDLPFRWRGRYNEDTDLSLRMLKAGWCTVQFNAFLQDKMRTQLLGGGNTEEFYRHEGTLAKSQMQVDMHPDVSRLTWKFGRVHHEVDYTPFKNMPLKFRPDYEQIAGINNYGLQLKSFRP